jgi:hypothetical protein
MTSLVENGTRISTIETDRSGSLEIDHWPLKSKKQTRLEIYCNGSLFIKKFENSMQDLVKLGKLHPKTEFKELKLK